MSDRIIGRKKSAASSFTNPSLASPGIPTLANPIRGFGSQINTAPPQTVTEVAPDLQEAQSANVQLSKPEVIQEKPLSHDINRIPLRRPQAKLTVEEPANQYEQEGVCRTTQRQAFAGRSVTAGIQRQPADSSPPAPVAGAGLPQPSTGKPKGILDGVVITTYADVAAFCRTRSALLAAERATILGEGAPAPAALFNAQDEGEQLAASVKAGDSIDVDDVTFEQADHWFSSYTAAMSAGEAARAMLAAQKLREVRIAAENAKVNNQQMALQVADKQREVYVSEDETLLSQLWNWSTALYDSILDFAPVIEQSREMEQSLVNGARIAAAQTGPNVGRINVAYKLPDTSTLLPLLESVNKAIAVIQLVQATADLVGGGKTASAKAKTSIKSAVAIASSVDTLIGMAAGIGLQLNLTIGPMTDACLTALSGLEKVAQKGNKDHIERGNYHLVNWDLEPGGRETFDFMRAVMVAQTADNIPTPVPSHVASYFVENRSEIEAGAAGGKEGDEMPTTGSWFWRKVDSKKIARWVFNHRQNLWSIFYGSAQPGVNH